MLFERGPIDLIPDDRLPTPGPRGVIEAAVADVVATLAGGDQAIAAVQGAVAGAGPLGVDPTLAIQIGDAAAEHERQARDSDPALGGVAAATDALEQELAGLSLSLADELRTPEPGYPEIPPGAESEPSPEGSPPPTPPPDPEKLPGWPEEAPVARGGSGGQGSDWIALYRDYMTHDVQRIHGRAPIDPEPFLPEIYHYWFGYIDDNAYNWLLSTYVVPYPNGIF